MSTNSWIKSKRCVSSSKLPFPFRFFPLCPFFCIPVGTWSYLHGKSVVWGMCPAFLQMSQVIDSTALPCLWSFDHRHRTLVLVYVTDMFAVQSTLPDFLSVMFSYSGLALFTENHKDSVKSVSFPQTCTGPCSCHTLALSSAWLRGKQSQQ